MATVLGAIIASWATLVGAAYLARVGMRLTRRHSAMVVLTAYALCALSAVLWLGPGLAGFLGACGLLLPCSAAIAIATSADRKPH